VVKHRLRILVSLQSSIKMTLDEFHQSLTAYAAESALGVRDSREEFSLPGVRFEPEERVPIANPEFSVVV